MSSILCDEATNIITSLGCKIIFIFRSHVVPKSCHVPKLDLVHYVLKFFLLIYSGLGIILAFPYLYILSYYLPYVVQITPHPL